MKNKKRTIGNFVFSPEGTLVERPSRQGFALMEIILMIVIIGIIGTNTIVLFRNSWKNTGTSNRTLVAGQMIERQIEALRMRIAEDADRNFPPRDSSYTENSITIQWHIAPAGNMGKPVVASGNVKKCDLTATWGRNARDSLKVSTFLAKNF
jgi:type II secretory pathway pseudopilin PulG